jgi:hypothetical protein
MGAEIIEQGASDSGLSDAPFIGADENDSWSGHGVTLQNCGRLTWLYAFNRYLTTLSAGKNDRIVTWPRAIVGQGRRRKIVPQFQ